MKIEIKTSEVITKSGTSKNGRQYSIREQVGYALIPGEAYPVRVSLPLRDEQPAYQPGMYQVLDESYMVGDFGRLTIGRLQLAPVAASASGKAA